METKETALKGGMVKYVIFLLCYILFNFILIRFVHNSYYQLAEYTVLGIAGVILSRNAIKEGCAMWKAHPVKNILIVLGGIVLKILLDNIAVIPYALLYAEQAGNLNDNNIAAASQAVNPILFAIISGILGPLTEETVFREILTRQASRFVPKVLAVIVSSLLFGVIHMHAITLCEHHAGIYTPYTEQSARSTDTAFVTLIRPPLSTATANLNYLSYLHVSGIITCLLYR